MAEMNLRQFLPTGLPEDYGIKTGEQIKQTLGTNRLQALYSSPEFQSMTAQEQLKTAQPYIANVNPDVAYKQTQLMATQEQEAKQAKLKGKLDFYSSVIKPYADSGNLQAVADIFKFANTHDEDLKDVVPSLEGLALPTSKGSYELKDIGGNYFLVNNNITDPNAKDNVINIGVSKPKEEKPIGGVDQYIDSKGNQFTGYVVPGQGIVSANTNQVVPNAKAYKSPEKDTTIKDKKDLEQQIMNKRRLFESNPTVKNARTINAQTYMVNTIWNQYKNEKNKGQKQALDQALITEFNKVIDPTSVVMVSEFARTASGQNLANKLLGYADKIKMGGQGLTDKSRQDIVNIISNLQKGQRQEYKIIEDQYVEDANILGVNPNRIVAGYSKQKIKLPTTKPATNKTQQTKSKVTTMSDDELLKIIGGK